MMSCPPSNPFKMLSNFGNPVSIRACSCAERLCKVSVRACETLFSRPPALSRRNALQSSAIAVAGFPSSSAASTPSLSRFSAALVCNRRAYSSACATVGVTSMHSARNLRGSSTSPRRPSAAMFASNALPLDTALSAAPKTVAQAGMEKSSVLTSCRSFKTCCDSRQTVAVKEYSREEVSCITCRHPPFLPGAACIVF